jgi:hypothetical protein
VVEEHLQGVTAVRGIAHSRGIAGTVAVAGGEIRAT